MGICEWKYRKPQSLCAQQKGKGVPYIPSRQPKQTNDACHYRSKREYRDFLSLALECQHEAMTTDNLSQRFPYMTEEDIQDLEDYSEEASILLEKALFLHYRHDTNITAS